MGDEDREKGAEGLGEGQGGRRHGVMDDGRADEPMRRRAKQREGEARCGGEGGAPRSRRGGAEMRVKYNIVKEEQRSRSPIASPSHAASPAPSSAGRTRWDHSERRRRWRRSSSRTPRSACTRGRRCSSLQDQRSAGRAQLATDQADAQPLLPSIWLSGSVPTTLTPHWTLPEALLMLLAGRSRRQRRQFDGGGGL
jgi:hypothetical protein